MTSFLGSRRRRIAAAAVLAFFLHVLLFQAGLSVFFSTMKPKIAGRLSGALGYAVKLEGVSYGYLNGLRLRGVSVFYPGETAPCVYLKDAFISVRILPLFLKKIVIGRARISEAVLLSKNEKEGVNLQVIYSDVFKKFSRPGSLPVLVDPGNFSLSAARSEIRFAGEGTGEGGSSLFFKNARILIYNYGKLKVTSDVRFLRRIPEGHFAAQFLRGSDLSQDFKLTLQASPSGNDLILDMLLLNLQDDQVVATGTIRGSAERNPDVEVVFLPSNISLGNITFLKERFEAKGSMIVSLKLAGKMDNVRPFMGARIEGSNFRYRLSSGEEFDIKNMNAGLKYEQGSLRLQNANLTLSNVPLDIELDADLQAGGPAFRLKASLSKAFFSAQHLSLDSLEAVFSGRIQRAITGELAISALYRRKGLDLEMQAYLGGIDFDYYSMKEKYLRAKTIKLVKKDEDSLQELNFSDFIAAVSLGKDEIRVKNVNFRAYDSILRGAVNIGLKGRPKLEMTLSGRNLDAKGLMEDMRITNKLLSGKLDIELAFNNLWDGFVKGACYIRGGCVDLNTLESAVKLPPLGEVTFDDLQFNFAVFRDSIKIRGLKLSSGDILLSGQWQISNVINGVLDVQIKSELLRESPQFRKLLDLAGIEKRYIDFRFVLGGIPKAIRLMWLKNEFKEKIDSILPARIKKAIEAELDKTVEGLSNK